MNDTSTLAFHLTYAGTLGMAFLIFLGQLIAFTALLALAATGRLLTCAVRAFTGRLLNARPLDGYTRAL